MIRAIRKWLAVRRLAIMTRPRPDIWARHIAQINRPEIKAKRDRHHAAITARRNRMGGVA